LDRGSLEKYLNEEREEGAVKSVFTLPSTSLPWTFYELC